MKRIMFVGKEQANYSPFAESISDLPVEVHRRNTIALNPERPESYHLLGVLRERYGEFELARKCYHIALVLDPTFEPAALNLERLCILPHRIHPVLDR